MTHKPSNTDADFLDHINASSIVLAEELDDLNQIPNYQNLPYLVLKEGMILRFFPEESDEDKWKAYNRFIVIVELSDRDNTVAKTIMDETGKIRKAIGKGFVFLGLVWKEMKQ